MEYYGYTGDEFRKAREKAQLSRAQLAARSYTFVYEIMNLEAGEKIPPNKFPHILKVLKRYLPSEKHVQNSATRSSKKKRKKR